MRHASASCATHPTGVAGRPEAKSACALCRYILHIIDMDPTSVSADGWLEDVTKVKKYEMSDEAYSRREDTFRKFKEARLMASAQPGGTLIMHEAHVDGFLPCDGLLVRRSGGSNMDLGEGNGSKARAISCGAEVSGQR